VPLIEPARVGVVAVDVDLEQLAAALSGHGLGGREQRGAESSARATSPMVRRSLTVKAEAAALGSASRNTPVSPSAYGTT